MSILDHYRMMYEYEKDCNHKMLDMIDSVPEDKRVDARFQRAVTLADHMIAGREKWLDFMDGDGKNQLAWWNDRCDVDTLRPRYAKVERQWTDYLARLGEERLAQEFVFTEQSNGESFSLGIEAMIVQLIGHAPYHRGQVALLVDQLGGVTVDTDYADWWWYNVKEKSKEA